MTEENKDPKALDEYFLKLTGKVEIPEPLEISNNFKVLISGAITEKRDKDNDDGSRMFTWVFEPIIVEAINALGKTLKARDPRSDSKLWRALMYGMWKESKTEMSDDEFYHFVNNWLRRHADEIVARALREL